MPRIYLELAYDGSPYCGWQVQPEHQRGVPREGARPRVSIQEEVESALFEITGEKSTVVASGRTDAGVHAIRQSAHADLARLRISSERLRGGLNAKLPPEVRVLRVLEVPREFHARFSATRKEYAYYLGFGDPLPHLGRYLWFLPHAPDLNEIRKALLALTGEHDFGAFQGRRAKADSTVRRIFKASIRRIPSSRFERVERYRISLVGSGFLKQMVRSIVGTVVEVGLGRRPASDVERILVSGDRSQVGQTAPSHGLWLERVWYPRKFGI